MKATAPGSQFARWCGEPVEVVSLPYTDETGKTGVDVVSVTPDKVEWVGIGFAWLNFLRPIGPLAKKMVKGHVDER